MADRPHALNQQASATGAAHQPNGGPLILDLRHTAASRRIGAYRISPAGSAQPLRMTR